MWIELIQASKTLSKVSGNLGKTKYVLMAALVLTIVMYFVLLAVEPATASIWCGFVFICISISFLCASRKLDKLLNKTKIPGKGPNPKAKMIKQTAQRVATTSFLLVLFVIVLIMVVGVMTSQSEDGGTCGPPSDGSCGGGIRWLFWISIELQATAAIGAFYTIFKYMAPTYLKNIVKVAMDTGITSDVGNTGATGISA